MILLELQVIQTRAGQADGSAEAWRVDLHTRRLPERGGTGDAAGLSGIRRLAGNIGTGCGGCGCRQIVCWRTGWRRGLPGGLGLRLACGFNLCLLPLGLDLGAHIEHLPQSQNNDGQGDGDKEITIGFHYRVLLGRSCLGETPVWYFLETRFESSRDKSANGASSASRRATIT